MRLINPNAIVLHLHIDWSKFYEFSVYIFNTLDFDFFYLLVPDLPRSNGVFCTIKIKLVLFWVFTKTFSNLNTHNLLEKKHTLEVRLRRKSQR